MPSPDTKVRVSSQRAQSPVGAAALGLYPASTGYRHTGGRIVAIPSVGSEPGVELEVLG